MYPFHRQELFTRYHDQALLSCDIVTQSLVSQLCSPHSTEIAFVMSPVTSQIPNSVDIFHSSFLLYLPLALYLFSTSVQLTFLSNHLVTQISLSFFFFSAYCSPSHWNIFCIGCSFRKFLIFFQIPGVMLPPQ